MNLKESLEVIKKYWNTAPVDVEAIARDLGVPIRKKPLPQNISGAIMQADGKYEIVVNANHSATRQRFTIAHELGHFIYHRDLLGRGVGDTRAYRAEGTNMPNPNISVTHERQANTFASNLLMPKHLIESLQSQGIGEPAALARALGVSEEAMRIRLGLSRNDFSEPPDDDAVEVRQGGRSIG